MVFEWSFDRGFNNVSSWFHDGLHDGFNEVKMSKKYHEKHPTISFKCRSIEEYNAIKKMVEISDKSESDYIREVVLRVVEKDQNPNRPVLIGLSIIWLRAV
jgi:hypothetical protein